MQRIYSVADRQMIADALARRPPDERKQIFKEFIDSELEESAGSGFSHSCMIKLNACFYRSGKAR